MCLPFICGGERGDHGSPAHSSIQQQPPSWHPQPYFQPSDQEDAQSYQPVLTSPVKEPYAHHVTRVPAGGEGKNGGAHAAGVNKNGEHMTAFGYSDEDMTASVGGRKIAVPTPATQAFKRGEDQKIVTPTPAVQAPDLQRTYVYVSASPRHHGLYAASHPNEAAGKMKAPLPVLPMARRGGGDDYPTSTATTPTPATNNFVLR